MVGTTENPESLTYKSFFLLLFSSLRRHRLAFTGRQKTLSLDTDPGPLLESANVGSSKV